MLVGEKTWETFLNRLSFGSFFQLTQRKIWSESWSHEFMWEASPHFTNVIYSLQHGPFDQWTKFSMHFLLMDSVWNFNELESRSCETLTKWTDLWYIVPLAQRKTDRSGGTPPLHNWFLLQHGPCDQWTKFSMHCLLMEFRMKIYLPWIMI